MAILMYIINIVLIYQNIVFNFFYELNVLLEYCWWMCCIDDGISYICCNVHVHVNNTYFIKGYRIILSKCNLYYIFIYVLLKWLVIILKRKCSSTFPHYLYRYKVDRGVISQFFFSVPWALLLFQTVQCSFINQMKNISCKRFDWFLRILVEVMVWLFKFGSIMYTL